MSDWLKGMKQKFDVEVAAKQAREDRERKEQDDRWKSAAASLESYVDCRLKNLNGKKTRDGEELRLELDKERSCAMLYAGDKSFLCLRFYYWENEQYDGDGCSWGDGTYYLKKLVTYYRPHKNRQGYSENAGQYGDLYEEDLAYYLLTFIDI